MAKYKLGILVIIAFCLSCRPNSNPENQDGMSEDFKAFYERFHQDSIYQMEHISFPLQGVPGLSLSGEVSENFRFEEADWRMHKAFEDSLISYHSLERIDENIVEEEIGIDESGLMIYRRFIKIGEEWYLSYYMAPNYIQKK